MPHQLMDKKISILKVKTVKDDYGVATYVEAPLEGGENIWAYYRQASANEFYGAASTNYKVEAIFKIRWRNDIDPTMKIQFRGTKYAITRIDDFEGNKEDLTIYAYVVNPKLGG